MLVPSYVSWAALTGISTLTLVLVWMDWRSTTEDGPAQAIVRSRPAPAAPVLTIVADASELPRGLMRSTTTWPVQPGRLWMRFPRWIQGTHAPSGAIENLAGLVVRDLHGMVIPWSRDPLAVDRFTVVVPAGCSSISVGLTYLANQPTTNSQPVDILESEGVATVNWNNCLLYPEGWSDGSLQVTASLRLPIGWRQASSLTAATSDDGTVTYATTDLRGLIDAPVLCGRNLQIHDLVVDRFPPHRLVAAAAKPQQPPPAHALAQLGAIAAEARELCGSAPFQNYTWLLGLGRSFPHLGLEHLSSSLNGLSQDSWFDSDGLDPAAASLLAHEYAHAWCGKHRRPAGMTVGDSHSVLDTRLLWIYEGFDQYMGLVLAARAGAMTRDMWMSRISSYIDDVYTDRSRSWRTLEDTASAGHTLRKRSENWSQLRGGQDYYLEGMLLCLEADGLIRRASNGARCFDDVLRRFLAPRPGETVVPFTEDEVVAHLRAVEPTIDWADLIERRIRSTTAERDLDILSTWGMRASWEDKRPSDVHPEYLDDGWSVGLTIWQNRIIDVRSGSPADAARVGPGGVITRVNNETMSAQAWDRILRETPDGGTIRLSIRRPDGTYSASVMHPTSRPRYLRIAPSTKPEELAILEALLAPRSAEGKAVRAAAGW
jgi:predicted metalloprotease with PDZ domain